MSTNPVSDHSVPLFPCPACGYLTFETAPGSFDICPLCYWEDDIYQLLHPTESGANKVSLLLAQKNFQKYGAVEPDMKQYVRASTSALKDPDWRLLTEEDLTAIDKRSDKLKGTQDRMVYYWRWNTELR
ncbi:cysteine-rich CPCC-domain-containing protein [Paraphysoderma sedebokerense]|nr:cysteine-rich CPCC-domain-containing protein [Paraphysoderma sedebokerense]